MLGDRRENVNQDIGNKNGDRKPKGNHQSECDSGKEAHVGSDEAAGGTSDLGQKVAKDPQSEQHKKEDSKNWGWFKGPLRHP